MFRSTKISNLKLKGIPRNNNEDRGPITSSTVFHSLKFKGMQDVHLCLYICMYYTVIRSTISGYPPLFAKRNSNSSDVRVFVFRLKEFASNLQSMDTSYVIRKLSWWNVNLRRCEDRKT